MINNIWERNESWSNYSMYTQEQPCPSCSLCNIIPSQTYCTYVCFLFDSQKILVWGHSCVSDKLKTGRLLKAKDAWRARITEHTLVCAHSQDLIAKLIPWAFRPQSYRLHERLFHCFQLLLLELATADHPSARLIRFPPCAVTGATLSDDQGIITVPSRCYSWVTIYTLVYKCLVQPRQPRDYLACHRKSAGIGFSSRMTSKR